MRLPDPVETVVYYGGTTTETERGLEYMGGAAVEATIFRDFLCYFQMIKIGTKELHYHIVERMWSVDGSDPEEDASGIRADEGIIHLLDDSDRTSDPEFAKAMANHDFKGYRRKVRTHYNTDGVEVDQLNEVTVNQSAQHEEIVILDHELDEMEFMNARSLDGQSNADDEQSDRHSSQVGKDGNNQMFSIAWAVVEGENRNSWGWFVHLVKTELLITDGIGWSVISDQQKKCKKAGHNSRKCQEPTRPLNPTETPQVPPTRTRRPREEQPTGHGTMTKRVKCGKCKAFGHNARTCTFVPGSAGCNEGRSTIYRWGRSWDLTAYPTIRNTAYPTRVASNQHIVSEG
ncbi:hypothetical protein LINPERHAP2_LOCUS15512 [Linum perenne]